MLNYSKKSAYSAPDPALVEQWKRKLSAREIGLVEGKVGPMLTQTQRRYEPSGHAVINPAPLGRFWLGLEHRFGRLAFSVRRYGLGLTALDALARRLPVRPLRRMVQRRFSEITVQHLK